MLQKLVDGKEQIKLNQQEMKVKEGYHQTRVNFVSLPSSPTRRRVSCRCTCSWSATRRRRCTGPIRASISLASATAQITPASSSIRTPGPDVVAVPLPSPLRLPSRWTPPPTLLSSSVPSTSRCPPHPAEPLEECLFQESILALNCPIIWYSPAFSSVLTITWYSWPSLLPIFMRYTLCFCGERKVGG